jgi:hypothetical protein
MRLHPCIYDGAEIGTEPTSLVLLLFGVGGLIAGRKQFQRQAS